MKETDVVEALNAITNFIEGYCDELDEEDLHQLKMAETVLYKCYEGIQNEWLLKVFKQ